MRLTYVCVSKTCDRTIELEIRHPNNIHLNSSPTCGCGASMKKVYSTPTLFRLTKTEVTQALHSAEERKDSDVHPTEALR